MTRDNNVVRTHARPDHSHIDKSRGNICWIAFFFLLEWIQNERTSHGKYGEIPKENEREKNPVKILYFYHIRWF